MTELINSKWAKLISLNPSNPNIHLTQPYQHQVLGEWKIYMKSPENTCWIQNLSPNNQIKIEDDEISLKANKEKEIFNGEIVTFIQQKPAFDPPSDNPTYVFCLTNVQSNSTLKRPREEPVKSPITEDSNKKLIKVENDLHQELTCSICMGILQKSATLSPCQHTFCGPCLFNHLRSSFKCPLCRVEATSVGKNATLQNLLQLALNNFPTLSQYKEEEVSTRSQPELFGDIIKGEVGTYIGAWKNNQRDGFGRMVYRNGAVYEGPWKENKREGKGTLTYADGSEYEGDWVNDVRDGHGNMKYQTGNVYNGEWKDGKKEGKGVFITQAGNVYDGEWMGDYFHGEGKYTWEYGDEYEGHFDNGCLSGYGVMRYSNGDVYKGEWNRNNRHGKGVLTHSNGDEYDGKWKNDEKHGKGKFTWKNEEREFDGLWENGEMQRVRKSRRTAKPKKTR